MGAYKRKIYNLCRVNTDDTAFKVFPVAEDPPGEEGDHRRIILPDGEKPPRAGRERIVNTLNLQIPESVIPAPPRGISPRGRLVKKPIKAYYRQIII